MAARLAGWLALSFMLALSLGMVAVVGLRGGVVGDLPPGAVSALRFTLAQAGLSALISVALAIPLARALARRRFRGRRLVLNLLAAPFLLPSMVAVLGLLAVFGRGGVISDGLKALGLEALDIYGLPGILLAHVFFNLPLATRLILQGWQQVPPEQFRLALQLGMQPADIFRHIEVPLLRRVLPGAFAPIFLLCSTSFAVVLALGGGPAATTLEVAIYQALRLDFDLGAAAALALVQAGICAILVAAVALTTPDALPGQSSGMDPMPGLAPQRLHRWADGLIIALALGGLTAPVLAVLLNGLPALLQGLPGPVWPAALRTIGVALATAVLTLAVGLALAGQMTRPLRGAAVWLTLAVSPFVMGTGLFLLIRPFADPFALSLPVTVLVNTGLLVPLALRALVPAMQAERLRFGRLAASLDVSGWNRMRLVTWPQIRQPAMFSAALAAALSAGDLGVIALFAPPGGGTLPLELQRQLGAYHMDDAAGTAVLLLGLTFGLFALIDRMGARDVAA